jgi:hypothetical protein
MSELTKGENRVRTQFNPSQNDLVSELKQKSAELINLCETMFPQDGSMISSEKARLIALAQTSYEEAAMWAVKAATI